jgi:hypothetical protein
MITRIAAGWGIEIGVGFARGGVFEPVSFLANCHRAAKLALCRDLLAAPPPPDAPPPRRWQDRLRDLTGVAIDVCPCCGGQMLICGLLPPGPPPRPPMWCDSS